MVFGIHHNLKHGVSQCWFQRTESSGFHGDYMYDYNTRCQLLNKHLYLLNNWSKSTTKYNWEISRSFLNKKASVMSVVTRFYWHICQHTHSMTPCDPTNEKVSSCGLRSDWFTLWETHQFNTQIHQLTSTKALIVYLMIIWFYLHCLILVHVKLTTVFLIFFQFPTWEE